jgi:L-amino acid N-acyltransferase YncA
MITLIPMQAEHAVAVLDIYRQGIASGMATFETTVPDWEKFNQKYLPHSRIVAIENNQVIGWATLSPVSPRECYSGVAEVSLYVHDNHQRKGIGRLLLLQLITESEQHNIWTLLSVIHQENRASIHLHEQCGFRYVGYRERVAQLNGVWRTTVMLEKRSRVVGQ